MFEKRQGIEKKTIFSKEVEKKQGNKKNSANLLKKQFLNPLLRNVVKWSDTL